MSSSMPDRRSVSLAEVKTVLPCCSRSRIRARAAPASSRISTAKPWRARASAARVNCWCRAGSANLSSGTSGLAAVASTVIVGISWNDPGLPVTGEGWVRHLDDGLRQENVTDAQVLARAALELGGEE